MMKTMEEEDLRFKEQYTTDTVRNTETLLDMINFKIEENKAFPMKSLKKCSDPKKLLRKRRK